MCHFKTQLLEAGIGHLGGLQGGQVVGDNEVLLLLLGVMWLGAYIRKHPYF